MNIYTIEDIRILAQIYSENIIEYLSKKEIEQYGGAFSYTDLMETIIKDKKLPGASLMEFLGAYESVVYDEKSSKVLHDFLFETPIEEMPLHINDEGTLLWQNRVATWRLKINK